MGVPNQFIEHRLRGVDQSGTLCLSDYAKKTGDRQTQGTGRAPSTPLVDEQEVGPSFDRKHNRFGLTQIQIGAKFFDSPSVVW